MKNSHIVLLSLLFVSSFVIPADPSSAPLARRLVRKKGHFDQCFDSPYNFGACTLRGTAIVATVGAAVTLTGGAAFVAYGAAVGASAAAGAAAGGGAFAVGSAALTGASAGGGAAAATIAAKLGVAGTSAYLASSGTTIAAGTGATAGTTILAANGLVSEVFSDGEYEVAPPSPRPAPAQVEKKEEKPAAPAPSSPRRNKGITRQDVAVAAGGGLVVGMFIEPAVSTVVQQVVQDGYDKVTGKRAKLDKQREEDLAIQREALDLRRREVAAQEGELNLKREAMVLQKAAMEAHASIHEENKLLHHRAREEHVKTRDKMDGLMTNINQTFGSNE